MIVRFSAFALILVTTACSNSVSAEDRNSVVDSNDLFINAAALPSDTANSMPPTRPIDHKLATARGLSVEELNDPARHYGYTPEDQAFLKEHGVSEEEARAAERILCEKDVDC